MKGIFLVKSRISVNDHDMEDFKIFKDTTRKEVEKLIKKGINELFEDSQEFELIDSFYTQDDDVSIDNFEIREIGEEEAMVLERLLGYEYGFGLFSRGVFDQ